MNYKTIQTMQIPDLRMENHGLYYHGTAGVRCCEEEKGLWLPAGEWVDFFTYFNGFYSSEWRKYAGLSQIRVRIKAEGDFFLSFCRVRGEKGKVRTVTDRTIHWQYSGERVYTVPGWLCPDTEVCYLRAEGAEGNSLLKDFVIEAVPEYHREIRLGVVICTYKREEEVKQNVSAICRMEKQIRPEVFLVDNGNTLGQELFPAGVRYIPNKNCGGTGGFTRGIMEAVFGQERSFTHIVLMDDDIVLDPAVLEKTIRFLSCLKPRFVSWTLSGALLQKDIPWNQYESGALWNRGKIAACRHDRDLRSRRALLENMKEQQADYGGWWYCCFPAEVIREKGLPLPLFVHRDDIEYGMRTGKILTLNGIGVWHEAFEQKIPQLGEYYDIRNMAIVNAVYLKDWTKKEWKWFLRKWTAGNLLRGRYEYIRLNMQGALDFLKGADWLRRTDAVFLHRKISGRLSPLKDAEDLSLREKKSYFWTSPGVSVYTAARKGKIVYEDSSGKCLVVKKSLKKALGCLLLLYKTEQKTDRCFERARRSYQLRSREMTTESFWKKYLEMEKK